MAASLIGIIELVWVNITSSTAPSHSGLSSNHSPSETSSAVLAP
jgi:hypothetical protein